MKSTQFAPVITVALALALALALVATGSFARTDKSVATPAPNSEAVALRKECAARHEVKLPAPAPAAGASEYTFVYYKGEYRGEHVAGLQLDCTEAQFTAFLETADPIRVMNAYPTAAGRPAARRAVAR